MNCAKHSALTLFVEIDAWSVIVLTREESPHELQYIFFYLDMDMVISFVEDSDLLIWCPLSLPGIFTPLAYYL